MNIQEYEREGHALYYNFALTVSNVLRAAIETDGDYRLQQITFRAKKPASLKKKIEARKSFGEEHIENQIKDLAGCRVIFYTNRDVSRFINSDIISYNFEILEVKVHHPQKTTNNPTQYTSNHYLVAFKSERLILPEYKRFIKMRCEIQIQTILNHAWAEMEHDIIYKKPNLGNFGQQVFDDIKDRMTKVARKYLVPAGYEFQKIATDFQRLLDGKEIFDNAPLDAIVNAADNNDRFDAIKKFHKQVLPYHTSINEDFVDIISKLLEAAARSKDALPVPIETPFGLLPAKSAGDILEAIINILREYRYIDAKASCSALFFLYELGTDVDKKILFGLGHDLASPHIEIWSKYGCAIQLMLLECIAALDNKRRMTLFPLLSEILGDILTLEMIGTSFSSKVIIVSRANVLASDGVKHIRKDAIEILMQQFHLANTTIQQNGVIEQLLKATTFPIPRCDEALAQVILVNIKDLLGFFIRVAPSLTFSQLQNIEARVYHFWKYGYRPDGNCLDINLLDTFKTVASAVQKFRDSIHKNPEFLIFKTLVGYNSVLPQAWDAGDYDYEIEEQRRNESVANLVKSINQENSNDWFARLSKYAETESDDAATFITFCKFLERLGTVSPDITLDYVTKAEGQFLELTPWMIDGLMQGDGQLKTNELIELWLSLEMHTQHIATYLKITSSPNLNILTKALSIACRTGDSKAVLELLITAALKYTTSNTFLREDVFIPAIQFFYRNNNFAWVNMPMFSWLNKPILQELELTQAQIVLDSLVSYPNISNAENILAAIAFRWPEAVIGFFGARLTFALTTEVPVGYRSLPFSVHILKTALSANLDLLIKNAKGWFNSNPHDFPFFGGRLLAEICPDLNDGLAEQLITIINSGRQSDISFAISVISSYDGRLDIFPLIRVIINTLPEDSELIEDAADALRRTGIIRGEFGHSELLSKKKVELETWACDPSAKVRAFSEKIIHEISQQIARAARDEEAMNAARRLYAGEELDDN